MLCGIIILFVLTLRRFNLQDKIIQDLMQQAEISKKIFQGFQYI